MVACGLGVALVPKSAATDSLGGTHAGVHFLKLERSAAIDLAAVWRRGGSPLVDDLIAGVQAAVGE